MIDKKTLSQDLTSSLLVFLIAMPLCLGVAIASGVDPIKGIFTGMIGGIVVGFFAGCPLQISGPSPGLAIMVLHVVEKYGVGSLVPLGIVVGGLQILTGKLKIAHYFQATPPALIKALLSGIGALIIIGQLYILFDIPKNLNSIDNLLGLPEIMFNVLTLNLSTTQIHSLIIASMVIVILFFWRKAQARIFHIIPGALVSILGAALLVYVTGWEMSMVSLPSNPFADVFNIDYKDSFSKLDFGFYLYALGLAFIASTETLLCVSAVDKMAKSTSNYNKQITALGIGNLLTGLVGAIPIVGVVARSAANIEFGAKSKFSNIFHGCWIGLFIFLPTVLSLIPIPALAGLLIFVGCRLLDFSSMYRYLKNSGKSALIFFVAFFLIISVDLLVGVVSGFAVALIILIFDVLAFDTVIEQRGENKVLKFKGKLSFLDLPVLSKQLQEQNLDDATNLEICLEEVEYIDPAISEHLKEFKEKAELQGKKIELDYRKLSFH